MIKPPGKPGIALYLFTKTTKKDTYGPHFLFATKLDEPTNYSPVHPPKKGALKQSSSEFLSSARSVVLFGCGLRGLALAHKGAALLLHHLERAAGLVDFGRGAKKRSVVGFQPLNHTNKNTKVHFPDNKHAWRIRCGETAGTSLEQNSNLYMLEGGHST